MSPSVPKRNQSAFLTNLFKSYHNLDLRLITPSGTAFTSKIAFFGLLPSLQLLLCESCKHDEVVIILPDEEHEDVVAAVEEIKRSNQAGRFMSMFTDKGKRAGFKNEKAQAEHQI